MTDSVMDVQYWDMIVEDAELKNQLISQPRIAEGIQVFPYKKGLSLLGVEGMEIFDGFGIKSKLSEFLPLLDGSRTINELLRPSENLSLIDRKELLANLFLSGFLRDGALDFSLSAQSRYFDFVSGYTLANKSGSQGMKRLKEHSLVFVVPEEIKTEIASQIEEGIGRKCRFINVKDALPEEASFLLVLSDGNLAEPTELFNEAAKNDCIALNIEMNGEKVRFGPLILPKRSASYLCYRAQNAPLQRRATFATSELSFWSALVVNNIVNFLSGVSFDTWINSFIEYQWVNDRQVVQIQSIARVHKWDSGGNPQSLNIDTDIADFDVWERYCKVALQSIDVSAPKAYHNHYKAKNIKAIYERSPVFYTGENIALAEVCSETESSFERGLNYQTVSQLLHFSLGYEQRNGNPHRCCPTGGNLGSTLAVILVKDIEGMEDGVFWFDNQENSLEKLPLVSPENMFELTGACLDAKLVLLSIANTPKVASKYGAFSYNISWYDAGLLSSFITNLAVTQGINSTAISLDNEKQILADLGIERSGMLLTGITAFNDMDSSLKIKNHFDHDYSQLVQLIRGRFATREWQVDEICYEDFVNLTKTISTSQANVLSASGKDLEVSVLLLAKLSDGEDGFYLLTEHEPLRLIKSFPRELHYRILSQHMLCKASVIALPNVNIAGNLHNSGLFQLDVAFKMCGGIVGDIWLQSQNVGYAGSACGGVFEGEVRSILAEHDLSRFIPLALCLGPIPKLK